METSLIGCLQAYEEAHNRHDVQGVMAMCTDDIRFEVVGVWVKVGKDNVRLLEEWDAAINGSLSLRDFEASDERVSCRAVERNDWFRLAGISEVEYTSCHFSFRQGFMAEMRGEMAAQSREAVSTALRSVMGWASRERGEVLARLMPGGEFVYGAETARVWLALLEEWRQSQSQGDLPGGLPRMGRG